MNLQKTILCCIAVCFFASSAWTEEEKVYSGPQTGEALPSFTMKYGFGENAGEEFDLVESGGDQPIVLIFVHKRSRPAFGLANAVMRYCNEESGEKLSRGICFLTADPTETQNWLGKIRNYFPKNTPVGYSAEGIEGPGAYGLNRNVELTILIGKDRMVVANFALVQPGAHVDGPKILTAIAEVIGATEKPDINKYLPNNQAAQDAPIAIDPGLMTQIRKLNNQNATAEMISEAINEIESLTKDNQPLQKQLGSILVRWVNNKRVNTIGNEDQQAKLKRWAKDFAPQMEQGRESKPQADSRLTGLLRAVIQKSNSDEQVDAAAKAVEDYVTENPEAARELARITNTVVNSDKLANYGTAHAQEKLKEWAEKYRTDTK